ncbi:uncharacterized protein LOC123260205 [Cotesia glomerata]|uniref:Uncharacterized protein n=1 Tax=Cotesia glomerata TaxID=32391 RepID=A0AAV7I1Y9_COTGL|nr:uncharacterized protein LOC123260205 [Cotesia glomerata]KAH0539824.1 hypothetical protein KQX54_008425 [Cotesia glomerata]
MRKVFSKTFFLNCVKISLNQLAAGDVVNDVNLDQLTGELVGNLFNGEMAGQYLKTNSIDSSEYLKTLSSITAFNCNNTFHSDYFPEIVVQASKKVAFNDSKLTGSVLGIDDRYIDNYFRVSFKNCVVKANNFVLIELKNGRNYPEDFKRWIERTRLSGAWRMNETSYVSSILTGDCVYQILVYQNPESSTKVFDRSKETLVHKGRISSASHNATLENWTNDLLNRTGQTLDNITLDDKDQIFNQFNNAAIIKLEIKLFPAINSQN